MKYQIVQCTSAALLQYKVNELMNLGWVCQGGYGTYNSSSFFGQTELLHCQAMVLTGEEKRIPRPSSSDEHDLVSVVLLGIDNNRKIQAIKEIRSINYLGLAETKSLVENPPRVIKNGIFRQEAEAIKLQLEAMGCLIKIE